MGQRVRIFDSVRGGDLEAVVCPPVFVDPEGVRSRG
jgi:sarcosine oxidase subunit alpha